jgi:ubiquinone/menaquinone biosynthesis C-methylase UbiE
MSQDLERSVARHYGRAGLKEKILAAIADAGLDMNRLKPDDLAPVDEFHTGGKLETEHVLAKVRFGRKDRVLDVGCGLGGAARYLATRFGCHVTGIDLTPEYVELATFLSEKTDLAERTDFKTASALQMPFDSDSFNGAVTFHVAMNIRDRAGLYREIARVLKPGATLCIYDVMKGPDDGVRYPVPWAENAENSYLTSPSEMHALLHAAGFRVTETERRSMFAIDFFRQRLASAAPAPPLGLHLLTGENAREKFVNYLHNVEHDTVAPTVMIAKRD